MHFIYLLLLIYLLFFTLLYIIDVSSFECLPLKDSVLIWVVVCPGPSIPRLRLAHF